MDFLDKTIKIKSAHIPDLSTTIDITKNSEHPSFNDIINHCSEFFGFEGYLAIFWPKGNYKICRREANYLPIAHHAINSDTIYYVDKNCSM